MRFWKVLVLALVLSAISPAKAASIVGDFVKEVLTQVAVSVVADAIKDTFSSKQPDQPPAVSGTADDRKRTENIIAALIDGETPLEDRIGLYATSVDYFSVGVVGHAYILKDRTLFESRWPVRKYTIRSIDEIAVAPDRSYVIARYTLDFQVTRGGTSKTGVSQVAVLIGSFNAQPRIHAIKEWVQRRR